MNHSSRVQHAIAFLRVLSGTSIKPRQGESKSLLKDPRSKFRIALEKETETWKDFRRALGEGNRERLDDLFNQARSNCMPAGNAVRPVVFEGMFMAVLFSHEKRLDILAKALEETRLEIGSG